MLSLAYAKATDLCELILFPVLTLPRLSAQGVLFSVIYEIIILWKHLCLPPIYSKSSNILSLLSLQFMVSFLLLLHEYINMYYMLLHIYHVHIHMIWLSI